MSAAARSSAKCGHCSSSPSRSIGWPMVPGRSKRSRRMSFRARVKCRTRGDRRQATGSSNSSTASDRIIASHACRIPAALGGGCGCCGGGRPTSNVRHTSISSRRCEWSDEVTRIQITRGDTQIATPRCRRSAERRNQRAGDGKKSRSLLTSVRTIRGPRFRLSFCLRATMARPGRLSPSTRHETDPLVVDASSLPGGESCRFRAVATAEFRSASADSESFSLPRSGPQADNRRERGSL